MKLYQLFLTMTVVLFSKTAASAQPYDFQNTKLKDEKRVELFMKHLTLDEKMQWLSPMLGTPRLGVPTTGCYEGLHGLALGGPSRNNGVKTVDGKEVPNLPTGLWYGVYVGPLIDPTHRPDRGRRGALVCSGQYCSQKGSDCVCSECRPGS